MIRCNNCMRLYDDESELLKHQITENGVSFEVIDACPNCLTDAYLTELESEGE